MTLYHGSDQIIKILELRSSTRTLDFGAGFYTTTNKEQAVNFAIYRTLIAFENGILSAAETIARLKVRQLFDQMTFASEKSLAFLEYSEFIEVPK
jgi:hypothetical protein